MLQTKTNINSLDLGCGVKPRNPLKCENSYGLDLRDLQTENVVQADVVLDPIPFNDAFLDGISAFDFIEHMSRVMYVPGLRFLFVELINEIHRFLKKGGQFVSFTPCFPSPVVFKDPTHVNIITEATFPN